ncbi:aspartate kinase [Prochlorococcus sp. MIT 1223]|uniref:aspartate kinase n=1 Tax=Prochlorococcus sp. MIT 1223 TaxID=3096217 RepID=UPI002A7490B5|nr:aspartate kinase [Prochlorococcus sp. MIT 1223]
MGLLVQKFGGTSVGTVDRIKSVAAKIATSKESGDELVIVVSAMGKTTDELSALAKEINMNPPKREMDMLLATGEQVTIALLSIALNKLGIPSVSMTGSQVGIITESSHGRARILEIRTERIKTLINQGYVVVVAGFQGTSLGSGGTAEITTLGRGGSDTSAVALAAALNASACEIYTDVPGVLTSDPRNVPNAQLMSNITCNEMLELASLGAAVLHPRAVEIARNYGVKLLVRSSWDNLPGTVLTSQSNRSANQKGLEHSRPVDGLELMEDQSVIGLSHIPDQPGVAANLFEKLSDGGVNVDLIIQAIREENSNDITFTVGNDQCEKAKKQCDYFIKSLGGNLTSQNNMAKLSISGAGIMGRPGIAATFFETLAKSGINIRLIATSEVKVSCVIDAELGKKALRAVSECFELSDKQINVNPINKSNDEPEVRGVALDLDQAQVSVTKVPDQPGTTAAICSALADGGITLDTIVQSERKQKDGSKDLSFTLKKHDRYAAENALSPLLSKWLKAEFKEGPAIARVSAVGAGMPNTVGTAGKMFRAIAKKGVNIEMIATSEIRTTCVVKEADGIKALNAVHEFFKLGEK